MSEITEEEIAEALEGSIEKWRKILDEEDIDKGSSNCPLCILFHGREPCAPSCKGCPVEQKVGAPGCSCTPYSAWIMHQIHHPDTKEMKVHCSLCEELAKDEYDFLIDLKKDKVNEKE